MHTIELYRIISRAVPKCELNEVAVVGLSNVDKICVCNIGTLCSAAEKAFILLVPRRDVFD